MSTRTLRSRTRSTAKLVECILCGTRAKPNETTRLDCKIGETEEAVRSYFDYFGVIPTDLILDDNVVCRTCYGLVVQSSDLYKVFAESVEVLKEIFKAKQRKRGYIVDSDDDDDDQETGGETEEEDRDGSDGCDGFVDFPEVKVKIEVQEDSSDSQEPPPLGRSCVACRADVVSAHPDLCEECVRSCLPEVKVERLAPVEDQEEAPEPNFTYLGDVDALWKSMVEKNDGESSSSALRGADCTADVTNVELVEVLSFDDDGAVGVLEEVTFVEVNGERDPSNGRKEAPKERKRKKKAVENQRKRSKSESIPRKKPRLQEKKASALRCPHCGKKFVAVWARKRHERRMHRQVSSESDKQDKTLETDSDSPEVLDIPCQPTEVNDGQDDDVVFIEDDDDDVEIIEAEEAEPEEVFEVELENCLVMDISEILDEELEDLRWLLAPEIEEDEENEDLSIAVIGASDFEDLLLDSDLTIGFDLFSLQCESMVIAGDVYFPQDSPPSSPPLLDFSSSSSSSPPPQSSSSPPPTSFAASVEEDKPKPVVEEKRRWECRYCPEGEKKTFASLKGRRQHEKASHPDDYEKETFVCDCCNRQFQGYVQYMAHIRGDREGTCEICGSLEKDVLYHMRRAHVRSTYAVFKCDLCDCKKFTLKSALNQHKYLKHGAVPRDDAGELVCELCSKVCFSRSKLETHLKTHFGIKPYHCEICTYMTVRRVRYNEHYKEYHPGISPPSQHRKSNPFEAITKTLTAETDKAPALLRRRVTSGGNGDKENDDEEEDEDDEIGGRGLVINSADFYAVMDHNYGCVTFKGIHKNAPATNWERFLGCRYCEKGDFSDFKSREAHEMVHHQDIFTYEKHFVCTCCYRKFHEHDSYYRHMKGYYRGRCEICQIWDMDIVEHDRRYHLKSECEICGKVLRGMRRNFIEHMNSAHGIIAPGISHYDCPQCDRKFLAKTALNQHRFHRHKILPEDDEDIFRCDMCPKIFFNHGALKTHRNRHLGSGRFSCPFCRYVAWNNQGLEKHCMAVHGKIKPMPALKRRRAAEGKSDVKAERDSVDVM